MENERNLGVLRIESGAEGGRAEASAINRGLKFDRILKERTSARTLTLLSLSHASSASVRSLNIL
jgi:hypothetical protein